jgi:hypothetical protein
LLLHTVIRSDNQDNHICRIGTALSHVSKGRVTGSIDECDGLPLVFHLIGGNVLRDPARFSGGNASFANGVEKGGFFPWST